MVFLIFIKKFHKRLIYNYSEKSINTQASLVCLIN